MTAAPQRISSFTQVQLLPRYIGPKEPGSGLLSMYMGTGVSDGGAEQANSRGNVIFGVSAGAANGDDLVGDELLLPPTVPDPTAIFDSTIIGAQACEFLKRGVGVSAFGRYALQHCARYGNNSAFGDSALRFVETGGNSAFGYVCLGEATTGEFNNGFGNGALHEMLSGSSNCGYGNASIATSLIGDENCGFGNNTLYNLLGNGTFDGNGNTAIGHAAGRLLEAGDYNIFIGHKCGDEVGQGNGVTNSILIGKGTVTAFSNAIVIGNTSHTQSQIFGAFRCHGPQNVLTSQVIGLGSGATAAGANNSLYGVSSGFSLTSGFDNTVNGWQALFSATTGFRHTAIGVSALQSMVGGFACTSTGYASGLLTTGNYNTYNGYNCGGKITSGTNNTFVGNETGNNPSQLATAVNSTAIGNEAYTTASNQVVIGNASVTSTVLRGAVTTDSTLACRTVVAPVAGGAQAIAIGSGGGLGVYWGSGAPAAAASQGSLYIRTDGSGTTNRMYINTDGGTTWTAVTTAA